MTHHNDEACIGALAGCGCDSAPLFPVLGRAGTTLWLTSRIPFPDSGVRDRLRELLRLEVHPSAVAPRFGATGYVCPRPLWLATTIANLHLCFQQLAPCTLGLLSLRVFAWLPGGGMATLYFYFHASVSCSPNALECALTRFRSVAPWRFRTFDSSTVNSLTSRTATCTIRPIAPVAPQCQNCRVRLPGASQALGNKAASCGV